MSIDTRGSSPDEPGAGEGPASGQASDDPWFDDDSDLEPLDLGGVIWLPLAKRLGIALVAIAVVAVVIWLLA